MAVCKVHHCAHLSALDVSYICSKSISSLLRMYFMAKLALIRQELKALNRTPETLDPKPSIPSRASDHSRHTCAKSLILLFFSLLTSNLSKSDQVLTTHRSPSTDNRDSFYRHPETVLGWHTSRIKDLSKEVWVVRARATSRGQGQGPCHDTPSEGANYVFQLL